MKGAIAEDSTNTASRPAPSNRTIIGMNHHDLTLKKPKSSRTVLILFTNLGNVILLAGKQRPASESKHSSLLTASRAEQSAQAPAVNDYLFRNCHAGLKRNPA